MFFFVDCTGLVAPTGADALTASTIQHDATVTFSCTTATHTADSTSTQPTRTCNDGNLSPTLASVPYVCNASKKRYNLKY